MGLFGKRATTMVAVVTLEGPGRLRLNGFRTSAERTKAAAVAHSRTVCWVEFDSGGIPIDRGTGAAARQVGHTDRLLRDLPSNSVCRDVVERLRQGEDSISKWLQVAEPAAR
jgi:hypothetical protein